MGNPRTPNKLSTPQRSHECPNKGKLSPLTTATIYRGGLKRTAKN